MSLNVAQHEKSIQNALGKVADARRRNSVNSYLQVQDS